MDNMESYKVRINNILVFQKKYQDPEFSAKLLAEELGISVFKLSRILKTEFGKAYTDIVHAHRIQDAKRYLMDHRFVDYTVDDIGTLVGFNNRQSFFLAFKKVAGTTPERFRHHNKA